MRLAAIFCVWDDYELLNRSIDNIWPLVDQVIVMYSIESNFGELSERPVPLSDKPILAYPREPDFDLTPQQNERRKRNSGLEIARQLGFTHFIMCDSDEMYEPEAFLKEKEHIEKENITGTVCRTKVYFKRPDLTIGFDTTLVPFIHKITPDLRFEWNTKYPFAFEGPRKDIRIDPTRQLNITSGVEMSEIVMHHYSWIRKDFDKKIRNSTARQNIENSTILKDLLNAKPGYFCEFYGKTLEPSSDLFNLCSLEFIKEQKD